jgi:flavin reductase (DIM6/NTAB) family NADH-FMN oxidoreductase RutF
MMAVSEEQFRHALSRFPSGVTIVTARTAAGHPYGITVSAFCSVSLVPPMVLVCIEKVTASHGALKEARAFVVNILHEDQRPLSEQFAEPAADKFSNVKTSATADGIPVIDDALANLECRLVHVYDGGDHTIFVGEVEHVTVRDGVPLIYSQGEYGGLKK